MDKKYVMALDQGTTSSRCILFDKSGRICSVSQREFPQIYPQPGWVEHDPEVIWETQHDVMIGAMNKPWCDIKGYCGYRYYKPERNNCCVEQIYRRTYL